MPFPIQEKLVVAVSSTALFDFAKEHDLYLNLGVDEFRTYQRNHRAEIPNPGAASQFGRIKESLLYGHSLRTSRDKNRAVSEYVAHENVDVILQKTLDLLRFVTVHQTHSETQTLAVSTTCPEYNSGFLGKGSAHLRIAKARLIRRDVFAPFSFGVNVPPIRMSGTHFLCRVE